MVGKSRRYYDAYTALYGKQIELPISSVAGGKGGKPSPKSKKSIPDEDYEQIISATWLDKLGLLWYHVPNGGYRRLQEAIKFKRMGVKPGVPDVVICKARKSYHGLYIELKRREGGKLSDAQIHWREKLIAEGYLWQRANGCDELKAIVMEYLG